MDGENRWVLLAVPKPSTWPGHLHVSLGLSGVKLYPRPKNSKINTTDSVGAWTIVDGGDGGEAIALFIVTHWFR